jgi:hypothetical protein
MTNERSRSKTALVYETLRRYPAPISDLKLLTGCRTDAAVTAIMSDLRELDVIIFRKSIDGVRWFSIPVGPWSYRVLLAQSGKRMRQMPPRTGA